jgi:hypothetical protein
MNREMGYALDPDLSLNKTLNRFTEDNILEDKFFSYQINLGPNTTHVSRNKRYVAMAEPERVALYDLIGRQIIWECSMEYLGHRRNNSLIVSSEGVVALSKCYPGRKKYLIYHIFFEGRQQGSIDVDDETHIYDCSLKIINGRFYAISNGSKNFTFNEWDMKGNEINEIAINKLYSRARTAFVANTDYYAVTSGASLREISSVMFIKYLNAQNHFIIEMFSENYGIFVKTAVIHRDALVCGVTCGIRKPKNELEKGFSLKVMVLNMINQKLEEEYCLECEHGEIKDIAANDDYIICHFYLYNSDYNYLWAIDRHTGVQKEILAIPNDETKSYLNFYFTGNLLHVCYPQLIWEGRIGRCVHTICVFDLSTFIDVKEVTYTRFYDNPMTFEDGKLVIIDTQSENPSFYVEDYEQVNGDFEQNQVDFEKWKRHSRSFL